MVNLQVRGKHGDGLEQNCSIFIALAMEMLQSFSKPSVLVSLFQWVGVKETTPMLKL